MATILHIDSSARQTGSLSRQLGAELVAKLQAANPAATVVRRDVAQNPLPHITEQLIGAFFTPAEQRNADQAYAIKTSDALVDELFAADTIVISTPMYNFSVASTLKAWIDHIARVGRTFQYGANGPEGLVTGKKVYVVVASGGVYSSGPAAGYDHVTTYLAAALGFIGMTDVTFIRAEGVSMGEAAVADAIANARSQIAAIAG
ncbi:FMN-dependent NADH-azoreductase [Duganella phyllosphaerae]|uniref:FMN dependent NADH:quinone oxidoreductase n=1 Tax=Duganella phyllosphaerae TaxID=762836 RepID=A0A1E7X6R3_9BURK|nr:FMN-dependent NADH-azoreductase [Duganella phyllosphaerae]OFA08814.1 FMN-dependent NADH-azoreductase [Duganella phyllosphaerae]